MRSCLGTIAVFALIELFIIGVGLGIGFLLSWLMPSIELGAGTIVGVVATSVSMYVFTRIITLPDAYDEPGTDVILDSPTRAFISSLEVLPARPRRKRKHSTPRDTGRKPQE